MGFRPVAMITTSAVKLSPSEVRILAGCRAGPLHLVDFFNGDAEGLHMLPAGGHEIHAVDALV